MNLHVLVFDGLFFPFCVRHTHTHTLARAHTHSVPTSRERILLLYWTPICLVERPVVSRRLWFATLCAGEKQEGAMKCAQAFRHVRKDSLTTNLN